MSSSSESDLSFDMGTINSPPSRKCSACRTDSYKFVRGSSDDVRVHYIVVPCQKHENNIFASPVTAQPTRTLSPSPTTIPTLAGATRRPAPSSSAAASVPVTSPDSPSPGPSTAATASAPVVSSPTTPTLPSSRYLARRKPSIPEDARQCYRCVRRNVISGATLTDAVKSSNISWRAWERKRAIAELMMLDRSKFDSLLMSGNKPATQQKLYEDCKVQLEKPEYARQRREARMNGTFV